MAERYDEAIRALKSLSSPNALVHAFLAASLGQQGGNESEAKKEAGLFIEKATALLGGLGAEEPESWATFILSRYPFKHEDDAKRLRAGLVLAGIS